MAEIAGFSLANYKDRIRAGVSTVTDLTKMPEWFKRNTRHPEDDRRPWSFKGHEYQIDILRDVAHELVGRKCSQVGFSELALRMALGLVDVQKNFTLIYVLPTATFASEFTKGRIDPVILASPQLKSARDKNVDSTMLKKFGNSMLYVRGSVGKTAGISVPAQGLIVDESDFCDQDKLSLFNSRLGHAGERKLKRKFSTPTLPDYGIDLDFQASSQAHYCVKCPNCYQWVAPNPLVDIEIPGFEGQVLKFEKEDLIDPKVKIHDAFLRCPDCRKPIPWKALLDKEKRLYVHKYPDRAVHGYQVVPYDVPSVNPLAVTLASFVDYRVKRDWVNMKLGYPFQDAETSFLMSAIDANTEGSAVYVPAEIEENPVCHYHDVFVGIDMGKTCWFTVLKEINGRIVVIYMERIRQGKDSAFRKRITFLCKYFGVTCAVMDAMPDISDALWFCEQGQHIHHHWACHYVRTGKNTLENFTLHEEEGIVKASRTETLNAVSKAVNTGTFQFTRSDELETLKSHLQALKRIDKPEEDGTIVSIWEKTGDDHYGHSLNYAYLAYCIAKQVVGEAAPVSVLPMVGTLRLQVQESDPRRPLYPNKYPGIDNQGLTR